MDGRVNIFLIAMIVEFLVAATMVADESGIGKWDLHFHVKFWNC